MTLSAPPLRVVHLADVHLGYRRFNRLTPQGFNQREADVSLAFREAIDRAVKLKPQLTIIAGDLFHTVRPSNAIITFAFRELRRLSEGTGAPIILIAGNHDTPRRSDSGSLLRLFGEIPGMRVADSGMERFDFPELSTSVLCLPHAVLSQPEIFEPQLGLIRADDRRRYNFLVAHAQVDPRLVSDFGGVDLELSKLVPHEWEYIALGHVHSRLDVGHNAAYSGSLEHTSANMWNGAKENKGFLTIDFPSGSRVFHALTSPREIAMLPPIDGLYLSAAELMERIILSLDDLPGGIEGKMVRLELANVTREQFRALDHRTLRGYRSRALNLTLDVRPPQARNRDEAPRRAARRPLREELVAFAEQLPGAAAKAPRLVSTVERFLKQLEEQDETRSA